MGDVFDVFDFVEGEVEAGEVDQVVEPADVRDEVVVEVELLEGGRERGEAFDFLDEVLAQADARYFGEAIEAQGRYGADARVRADDLFRVRVLAIQQVWGWSIWSVGWFQGPVAG
jgi:hypothetical protein